MSDKINIGIQEEIIHLEVAVGGGGGGGGVGVALQGSGSYTQGTGTIVFQTSPTITFGLATNGIMTASGSTHAHAFIGSINTAMTGGSMSVDAGGLSISVNPFKGGVSTIGNTLGDTKTVSNQIVFAGGNNITLSQSTAAAGATITISGPNTVAQSNQPRVVSINGTSGSLTFNAGTFLGLSQDGVSFTYSVKDTSAFTTLAFPSANTTKFALSGFTTTSVGGTEVVGTHDSLGLKLGVPAFLTAAVGGGGIAASVGGNATSGGVGYSNITSGTIHIQGGNNITLSQDGASVTISGAGATVFSNSNNINFGLAGSTVTASATGLALAGHTHSDLYPKASFNTSSTSGTALAGSANSDGISLWIPPYITTYAAGGGSIAFSAGASSDNLASMIFSNSNNVSFGLAGSTVTASVTVAATTYPAVQSFNGVSGQLTFNAGSFVGISQTSNSFTINISDTSAITSAAFPSANTTKFAGPGTSSTTTTGVDLKFTQNSQGLSYAQPAYITTYAAQSAEPRVISLNGTSGSLTFNAGTFLGLSQDGVSFTYSVKDTSAFTSAAFPSADTTKFAGPGFTTTAVTGTELKATLNSSGLKIAVPAYITTYAAGGGSIAFSAGASSGDYASLIFSNSNNISFGLNGSTVTASASYSNPGATVFSNSNNVTFGLNGSTITASVTVASTSEARVISINGSSGSISFNTGSSLSSSADISGITFGLASNISTAWSGQTTANQSRVIDFNGSSGQISFVTGSGMSTTTNASTLTFGLRSDISTAWSGQTTANQSRVVQINGSSGTLSFATGSSLSSSQDGSTITWGLASNITSALQSANANYLTVQSNQPRVVSLNGSSGSMSINVGTSLSASTDGSTIIIGLASNLSTAFQTAANYLTTAAQVSHTHGSISTASTAGSDFTYSSASNGMSFSIPKWITTYVPGGGGDWSISATNGTNILISTGAATNTLYQPAFITTYAGGAGSVYAGDFVTLSTVGGSTSVSVTNTSNFTYGHSAFVGLASTSITGGSATINSSQLYINIPSNAGSLGYQDSNGVTFGVASTASNSSTVVTASIAVYGGTSFQTTATNGTAVTAAINTAGMTLAVPAYITTAAAGGGDWSISATNGTNVLISTGVTNTLYQPAFITTYAAGGSVDWATSAIVGTGISIVTGAATNTLQYGPFLTTYAAQTVQPVAISASNGSYTFNTLTLGTKNGFTFYTDASGLQGSYTVPAVTTANYAGTNTSLNTTAGTEMKITLNTTGLTISYPHVITTALGTGSSISSQAGTAMGLTANSDGINIAYPKPVTTAVGTELSTATTSGSAILASFDSYGLKVHYPVQIGTSFVTTATAGTAVVGTLDTAGLKLGVPAYLTVAPGGGGDWSVSATNGTDILITTGAATHTLYQPSFLTTQSAHTQFVGLISTGLTGGSWTINSSQLSINIPSNAGSLGFADSNGVTFGIASTESNSSTVVTASINTGAGGAALQGSGAYTQNSGTIAFANSNGITFGLSTNQMTASYNSTSCAGQGTTITGNASITLGSAGMSFNGLGLAGTTTAVTGRASITLNSSGLQFNGTGLVGVSTYITGNASISLNSNGMSFNGSGLAGTNTAVTNCAITVNSSGVSVFGTVGSGTTLGTSAGTAMAMTLNTAGLNITYPAVGYLSLINSNGYTWSTSTNGVTTAIWLVLAHTA
jgi:hypothetical protein